VNHWGWGGVSLSCSVPKTRPLRWRREKVSFKSLIFWTNKTFYSLCKSLKQYFKRKKSSRDTLLNHLPSILSTSNQQIFCTNIGFGRFFEVTCTLPKRRSYEKFVRLTLMKFIPRVSRIVWVAPYSKMRKWCTTSHYQHALGILYSPFFRQRRERVGGCGGGHT